MVRIGSCLSSVLDQLLIHGETVKTAKSLHHLMQHRSEYPSVESSICVAPIKEDVLRIQLDPSCSLATIYRVTTSVRFRELSWICPDYAYMPFELPKEEYRVQTKNGLDGEVKVPPNNGIRRLTSLTGVLYLVGFPKT